MKWLSAFLALGLFTQATYAAAPDSKDGPFRFSGSVKAGEVFYHKLPGDLYFNLYPSETDWVIMITDSTCYGKAGNCLRTDLSASEKDYKQKKDAMHIYGWQLHNTDVRDEVRKFGFAASKEEFRATYPRKLYCANKETLDKSCVAETRPEFIEGCKVYRSFDCNAPYPPLSGKATFTIGKYKLTDPAPDGKVSFKNLDFTVEGEIAHVP